MVFPPRPAQGATNWYATREAYDDAIEEAIAPLTDPATLVGGDDIDVTHDEIGGTIAVSLAPDFPNRYRLQDHFMGGGTETGEVGELGWTAAGVITQLASAASMHGVVQIASPATINGPGTIFLVGRPFFSTVSFDARFRVRLDTGNADTMIRVGFADGVATASPTAGIYFEKAAAETTWHAVCRSASVETRTNTAVAVSSSFATLRVRRVSSTQIGFSIDGGTEIVVATNIPSAAMFVFVLLAPTTAVSKTCAVDWFDCLLDGLGAA